MNQLEPVEFIPRWDCYDWRNAKAILDQVHTKEWKDVISVLSEFRLLHSKLAAKGKNKTEVSKSIDSSLYKLGWVEKHFDTKIVVDKAEYESPTHSVDCFKGKVAIELEWNNKDPFYDRDLNNFRLLFDLRVVDVGIIVTRSTALQKWLHHNHKMFEKAHGTYGASTTHFDKLETRIIGGGAGGCPVFVFAMTEHLYLDDR